MKNVWFIVFCESSNLRFGKLFTRPGFEHCLAFSQGSSSTVMLNYNGSRQVVTEFPCEALELAQAYANDGKKVLCVEFESEEESSKFTPRGLLYCVSMVKCLLGLTGCFALTPYSLYQWLKKSDLNVVELKGR